MLGIKTDSGTDVQVFRPDDRSSYFCHGFTFDGAGQPGGPYSIDGGDVRKVLEGDGWQHVCCGMASGGIVVFNQKPAPDDRFGFRHLSHSGKIRSVAIGEGGFDANQSTIESKWGWTGSLSTQSFSVNAAKYGTYQCFVKKGARRSGCCPRPGQDEDPPR
jgi:hypothetical protein